MRGFWQEIKLILQGLESRDEVRLTKGSPMTDPWDERYIYLGCCPLPVTVANEGL